MHQKLFLDTYNISRGEGRVHYSEQVLGYLHGVADLVPITSVNHTLLKLAHETSTAYYTKPYKLALNLPVIAGLLE